MKKSKLYILIYCFVMIFILAIVNYKQVFSENIGNQFVNLVKNGTFKFTVTNDEFLIKQKEKMNSKYTETKSFQLDKSITLNSNKRWLLNSDYTYKIRDERIASLEDGFVVPRNIGKTELVVSSPGRKDKIVTLVVEEDNQTFLQLLQKWNSIILGLEYFNTDNSRMNKIFEQNEIEITTYLEKIQKDDKKIWDDLDDYSKSANLTKTYRRLEQIAKSVTNPKSKYYNDKEVISTVKRSMKLMEDNYYN